MSSIYEIISFISSLDKAKINYTIEYNRNDAISILAVVPGERWEIDFVSNGTVEVEIFKSDGELYDNSMLNNLFEKFSD
jgi:hypothetical protein